MDEVLPAVLDGEAPRLPLALRLVEKVQLSPVINLPDQAVSGEDGRVGQGGARRVLAQAGGVDDQGVGLQGSQSAVVVRGGGIVDELEPDPWVDADSKRGRLRFAKMMCPGVFSPHFSWEK